MKITRQNLTERYSTSASWLNEFAYDIHKGADHVDYLKQYFDSRRKKKYQSIEEKLADIKERVGFDLARKISEEVNPSVKITNSDEESDATNTKTAQYKHPQKDIDIMKNIIQYAKDMIQHEPYLDPSMIMTKIRQEDGLRLNEIRMNVSKFMKFLESEIAKHNGNKPPVVFNYIPEEPITTDTTDDSVAEYYSHAEPKIM